MFYSIFLRASRCVYGCARERERRATCLTLTFVLRIRCPQTRRLKTEAGRPPTAPLPVLGALQVCVEPAPTCAWARGAGTQPFPSVTPA